MNMPQKRFSFQLSALSPLLRIFLPILLVLILYIFWDGIVGIPRMHSLWSMDGYPLYDHDLKAQTWRELTGRNWLPSILGRLSTARVFHPDDLLKFIFPPLVYHLMSWICAFLLMAGAMLYLMYSYGIRGLRAALPAMAFGFSGYTFTLISAGHRATPMTMGYAVLTMALVRNGIRKNTISHFIAAALACVYGIINQMDVMGFMLFLIAGYGLLELMLAWPLYRKTEDGGQRSELGGRKSATGGSGSEVSTSAAASHTADLKGQPSDTRHPFSVRKLVLAIVMATLVFTIVGWPFLSNALIGTGGRSTVEAREVDIKASGGNRWEFITNWSLPPEGILEFIAPSVFGRENVSRERPYWGRLGQSMHWRETGQGFRNFRQHNLYIGGIQIAFAFYALLFIFRRGAGKPDREQRTMIGFWWGVTVLTLLLAFGRYFPLYRIVFHMPLLKSIRCPVKWFHLTEISIVVLMGFGLWAFTQDLRNGHTRPARRFAVGVAIAAGILLIASGAASATGFGLQPYWAKMGLDALRDTLRTAMAGSLFHGALVFAALATVLWFWQRHASRPPHLRPRLALHSPQGDGGTSDLRLPTSVPCPQTSDLRALAALLLVLSLDLAVAHKPFIHIQDVSAFYAPNPIAEIILKDSPPYRLADYLTSGNTFDPLWRNMTMKGVEMLPAASQQVPYEDVRALLDTFKSNPLRLWQVTSTRFIMGQRKQLAQLIQHPDVNVVASFTISPNARFVIAPPQSAPYVLLEYTRALPRVQLYHSWEVIPDAALALRRLADPAFDPSRTALLMSDVAAPHVDATPPTTVTVQEYGPGYWQMELPDKSPGVLLQSDRYDTALRPSSGTAVRSAIGMQATVLTSCPESLHVGVNPTLQVRCALGCHLFLLLLAGPYACAGMYHAIRKRVLTRGIQR